MRALMIVNPIAGAGKGTAIAEALRFALERRGVTVSLAATQGRDDARRLTAECDTDCAIAIGGDGTAHEVANGCIKRGLPVAFCPVGTANVVARELRMPRNPDAFAALVARGETRPMDTGRHDSGYFLLGAGAGLDAAVVKAVHARRGATLSYWDYVAPAWNVLTSGALPRFRVVADGEEVHPAASYAVVGNCKFSAGAFQMTPLARLDDGLLDLAVIPEVGIWDVARLGLASFLPGFEHRRGVLYRQARVITFEPVGDVSAPMQIDGDPMGCLPATFNVEPAALRVIAPAVEERWTSI